MIISERTDIQKLDFEILLKKAHSAIENSANKGPDYFLGRSATEFESDVFDALCEVAKGKGFDKTIYLVSGHRFPDIVVNKYYEVDVKTTKQNYWKSTGNSVLESTRIEDAWGREAETANRKSNIVKSEIARDKYVIGS